MNSIKKIIKNILPASIVNNLSLGDRKKIVFSEHGYTLKNFNVEGCNIEYAQWLHPLEGEKIISNSEVNFFKKFIKKGDIAVDIGAHTGDTSLPMALAAGIKGAILAIEPNKYVFKILAKNSELNKGIVNIIPLECAVSTSNMQLTFHYSDASFCNGGNLSSIQDKKHSHPYTLIVEGKRLIDILNQKQLKPNDIKFIKMDCEGYDKEILKSINEVLIYKPTLLIECFRLLNKQERGELFDIVNNIGYKIYRITSQTENTGFYPILKAEDMCILEHFDFICTEYEI